MTTATETPAKFRTYDLLAISVALSPLTHNRGSEGNETLVNVEKLATPEGIRTVPVLSGNAIRHRMIREPGALYLIDALGLRGELSIEAAQFLFNGGALYESGPTESLSLVRDFHRLFPLGRVLGGAFPSLICGGRLACWRGTMICRENAERLRHILPEGWLDGEALLRGAEDFVGQYQYTRGDAIKRQPDLLRGRTGDELLFPEHDPTTQMIFSGQAVLPGSMFVHGFRLDQALPRDLGALVDALARWNEASGTIGGSAAKGHGRLALALYAEGIDLEAARTEYLEYVAAHAAESREWLMGQFGGNGAVPATTKKKKGRK